MISTGNNTGQNTQTNNKSFGPKTGLLKATVAAINPTQEQVNALLGRDVKWNTAYTGKNNEGEQTVSIEIWLKEVTAGDYYRMKFLIVDKQRESKTNPGSFQFINTAGQTLYAASYKDIELRDTPQFKTFRSRKYRFAMVGEENLSEFLVTWITQGKKVWDSLHIDPDMPRIFKGDFSELQEQVSAQIQMRDGGVVTALATYSENGDKKYQNLWKRIAPSWYYEKIQQGDKTGRIGEWLDEIQGKWGVYKDVYDLNIYLSGGTTVQQPATPAGVGFNHYGKNPGNTLTEIPGAKEYQQRSNTMSDGNPLPF